MTLRVAAAGALWLVAPTRRSRISTQPRAPEKAKACDFPRPEKARTPPEEHAPGQARTPNYPQLPTGGRGRGPVRPMPVAQVLSQVTFAVYRHRVVRPACDGLTHRHPAPHPKTNPPAQPPEATR
ncbi:hypothetical protein GCM10010307_84730 [Streptomyces vastus]|uniref:Secreted protein n=1 Tax=Streptomyces vastus TaxID=285451 RepID=A0ABN3RYK0_9ACTN